jgi:hypothetical protein
MGYEHIENLYKSQDILLFKECYALEKIHGTSAHLSWRGNVAVGFFSGGESPVAFRALFDEESLKAKFSTIAPEVTVYGEAYGGKCMGMRHTYGDKLRFIVFDVKIGDVWLAVPNAEDVTKALGLEFVPYVRIPATVEAMDAERDAPSVQSVRNGIVGPKPREGIVCRPLIEVRKNNEERVIGKHKRDDYKERATPQKIVDPAKLKVLEEVNAIADEWTTEMRLTHVLDKIPQPHGMELIPVVIRAMQEDILREAKGEIVESKEALRAIGTKTREMYKQRVQKIG